MPDGLFDVAARWGGYVAGVGGVIGTVWYRRKSLRQRRKLIELEEQKRERRIELSHVAFQEFQACDPPLLQVRVVLRNLSERQEVVRGVFLEDQREGVSQVHFEGRHTLEPHGLVELATECPMPEHLPTEFLIHLVDGTVSGPLRRETTSHGVFPSLTPEQLHALAEGDVSVLRRAKPWTPSDPS